MYVGKLGMATMFNALLKLGGWGRRVNVLQVVGGHEVGVRLEHNGIETMQEGDGHCRIAPREGDRLRQGMPHVQRRSGTRAARRHCAIVQRGRGWRPARLSIRPRHRAGIESRRPTPSSDIAPPCSDCGAALLAASAGQRSSCGGNSPWQRQHCGLCARACACSTIWQILAIAAVVIYFAGEASTSSNLSPSNAAIQPLITARLCARLRCISSNSTINTINIVHCLKGPN